jgi:hypothetical protein
MKRNLVGVAAVLIAALLFVGCSGGSTSADVSKECKEVFERKLEIDRTNPAGNRAQLEAETRTIFECRTSNEWTKQFKEYQSKGDGLPLSDEYIKLNLGNICRNAEMAGSACRDSDGIPVPTIQPKSKG